MIRMIGITKDFTIKDISFRHFNPNEWIWYWIDFNQPSEEETIYLQDPLQFHPLAIEDCINKLQRPKLDYYDQHTFYVTHRLGERSLEKEEINFFVEKQFIVTYHHLPSPEIDQVWERLIHSRKIKDWNPYLVFYYVLDKIVDNYFPFLYEIEDTLNDIEDNSNHLSMEKLLDQLFETRHHLLSLRHTIIPMRDLLYRMLNSHRLETIQGKKEYFADIYDHLLKLSEMIDANREITADIRDSYISYNSHQTNRVMKVLTVITTIFMPLTFIAGIYGMNFEHMPELRWEYGYFLILLIMLIIGGGMYIWFKKKGWFR
ncbi:magnesium/cobalt transporter CorA [Robertmurraya sp.]|jgi:magnesium transporter|uniref:magnesium/cobalt transporter CorA n=1 Tax=Robertmurraya sp. TaxID=2837525 RepID=UPI0037042AAF